MRAPVMYATVGVLTLAACQASITLPTGTTLNPTGPMGTQMQPLCQGPQPMRVPTQRLNDTQYLQVLQDLFGTGVTLDPAFPVSSGALYSTYPESNIVQQQTVQALADTADELTATLADTLPTCTGGVEATCARDYLTPLAARALRRPATSDELDSLVAVFTDIRADATFSYAESLAMAISALLQMPAVLYALEDSAPGTSTSLDDHQVATRLALLYAGGLPDTELSAQADQGLLQTSDARLAEATRLAATDRGHVALAHFVHEWLGLQDFTLTQFADDVHAALEEELVRMFQAAMAQPDGFTALLTSNRGYVNTTLEQFYGLPTEAKDADGWRTIDFPMDERVGVLTHPLFLARTGHDLVPSVVLRGKFVREALLCTTLGAPPPGAQAAQPMSSPDAGIRGSSEARMAVPLCGGCHTLMDPIGWGFLQFDGAGTYDPTQDASGEVRIGGDVTGTFTGVRELGERLAASDTIATCFSTQWLRFAFGKTETSDDSCNVSALSQHFVSSGKNLNDLFLSLSQLDGFATRELETAP